MPEPFHNNKAFVLHSKILNISLIISFQIFKTMNKSKKIYKV